VTVHTIESAEASGITPLDRKRTESRDGLTHDWLLGCPQVPSPQPGVDARTDNDVRILSVPVDVRYCPVMRMQRVLYGRLARKAKVPDKS
jgi:hypothetical protein